MTIDTNAWQSCFMIVLATIEQFLPGGHHGDWLLDLSKIYTDLFVCGTDIGSTLYPTSRSDRIDPKIATHKRLTRQVKPVFQPSRKPLAKHVPGPFFLATIC
jgi:hypothetical protein